MNAQTSNALTPTDGFDIADPSASPIHGTNIKFKDGGYFAFGDKLDVRGKSFAVLDKREGWQKLQRDCPPEFLIRTPGEPRPPKPHVAQEDWPLNLNGEPEHPWKLTHYLDLLDVETGETSTFWTNTVGGRVAVDALSEQVAFMRRVRPDAVPVIALESKDMPTQYGGTKPRPHFRILGWKARGTGPQGLLGGPVSTPPLSEQMGGDSVDY
jgi:hypothetical protein